MRFNMINWLLETVSLILVMFVENVFLNILYLLVHRNVAFQRMVKSFAFIFLKTVVPFLKNTFIGLLS